jgi:Cu(I)/Ag(I) efflux system membrane fusion protein
MQDMSGMTTTPEGAVQLTANEIRHFGVTFGSADVRPLIVQVRAVGTVTLDERTVAQITPKVGGYVERLYVNSTGQSVRRGAPLATIYSPELLAAEQDLLVAGRLDSIVGSGDVPGVPGAGSDLVAASKRRLELWDVSDAQINEILRTGKAQRTETLFAPTSGIVVEKNVVQGQAIQPGMALYTIADLSTVWIDVALRETDAGRVRPGSSATIDLASFPGHPLAGRVSYVYPTLDSITRAIRARVVVPNPGGRLKPGMYATVSLATPASRALTVPASAVFNTGARTLVFVDLGGGRLAPRQIVTGRAAGDYTEVLSGVIAGQRVVTSEQFLLDAESNLAEVMKSMIGQMGESDVGDMKGMNMGAPSPSTTPTPPPPPRR